MQTLSQRAKNIKDDIKNMSKQYTIKDDPNKKEEALKYDNPIPSRDVIIQFLKDQGAPVVFESITEALKLDDPEQHVALKRRLRAMERDGQILYNRKGFYGLLEKMDLFEGKVVARMEGPGEVQNKTGKVLYLPTNQMKRVFHGDIIIARPVGINAKGKLEGEVMSILSRNTQTITGRYFVELDSAFVTPINAIYKHDILILKNEDIRVDSGSLVNIEIISQPTSRTQPLGRVLEVLGTQVSTQEAIDMAVKTHNLSTDWDSAITKSLTKAADSVSEADVAKRADLRHLPFVTIDGADAKDFDDAVYCETKKSGGWRLYVGIADVSNYVQQGTKLDLEARARSTSVYFPGHVIPMLPEKLSNELCSLQPHVDRLSLICEMTVSAKGKLTGYKFYSATIKSKARLTYDEVADLLENDDNKFYKNYPDIAPHIYDLHGLFLVLLEQRKARGAIDFDVVETQINLNDRREIESIQTRSRNDAHRLIEECMLLTNVSAAKFIEKNESEAPFRVHGAPLSDRITGLRDYLKSKGLSLGGGAQPRPKDYSDMLKQAEGRSDFDDIQLVALRSMNQAVYSPENEGHYGLAYEGYSHFTSPIRRYPDLIVHRVIKSIIGEKKLGGYAYSKQDLMGLCDHASTAERRADIASRDVEDWLKCSFMKPRIGDVFKAKIVSVLGFGFFVRLQENYIDGLIHVSSLSSDYFHFDAVKQMLIGERTRTQYKLGDELDVKLINVDMTSFKIDFEIDGMVSNASSRNRGKNNRNRKPRPKQAQVETTPKVEVKENQTSRLRKISDKIKRCQQVFTSSDKTIEKKKAKKAKRRKKPNSNNKSDQG